MIFIKLPTTCTLLLNSVKMVTFTTISKKNTNSPKTKPKNTLNKSWKAPNTYTPTESSTETSNPPIYSWREIAAKSATLDLPKACKMKILSWNRLLEPPSTCPLRYWKKQNIQQSQICGPSASSTMKCFTAELPGQLPTKCNSWMAYTRGRSSSARM